MNEWPGFSQADEPTLAGIQREYPHLICRKSVSGLYYAYPRSGEMGEPLVGPAEDPRDLLDGIIRAVAMTEGSNSGG